MFKELMQVLFFFVLHANMLITILLVLKLCDWCNMSSWLVQYDFAVSTIWLWLVQYGIYFT